MRKRAGYTISIMILLAAVLSSIHGQAFALANNSSYAKKATLLSKVDLRKYFEKAMAMFEASKYKEAIAVFENLIEVEKSQNESYFTPFAEIYIEKSRDRIKEMFIVEDRRWQRMKKQVIAEAEELAGEEAWQLAREERDRIRREEERKKRAMEEAKKKEARELTQRRERILREEERKNRVIEEAKERDIRELREEVNRAYEEGLRYYKEQNYPLAIVEFKKIEELDTESRLISQAESFIEKAQAGIKREEQRGLMARMEAARRAKIEAEREQTRMDLERERQERQKVRLKKIFDQRLRARVIRERIKRVEFLLDTIRRHAREEDFEQAEEMLHEAMAEFPENRRFKDILHYVEIQRVRMEEKALKRAREITEERMLLEVAKRHMIPDEVVGVLKKEKKITPLVKVPQIRKRLEIPISVDFNDVELDYVLGFLSDATGVNIVLSSEIDTEEKRITIRIKDMPLEEALRYILKSQDLIYRIEEDAVWVATREELDNEAVETRVYFLNQGIGKFVDFAGGGSEEVKTIKDILENAVDWPKDSKLNLDDRTGALIISNIPSNLEIVENLLYNLDVTPVQVLIEARFLEVVVTDVDELGFEWKLNSPWGMTQTNAKQDIHGFASNSGVDFSNFSNQDYGFNLTYQGILSHPQFQAVLHAFQQKQNVKTLSSPRITTLNNQTATIEVIDEFIYPTRYEVSLVQYDINGDGDFDDAGETEWANIPQDFVTRDVGILLHVKPSVGVDGKVITLALTPEVSEQDTTTSSYSYTGSVSIPNFKTRNLSTSVIIGSGETVVMGGLIKESNTNTKTKVPFLGDLPLVGGMFKKNYDSVERRNLLIFVTAKVLNKEENVVASASQEPEQIRREQ